VQKSPAIEVFPTLREDLMSDFDADATIPSIEKASAESFISEPLPIEQSLEMPRYSLRNQRSSWLNGPWQYREKKYESGLHISAGAAIERFGNTAIEVILKELQQMVDKKVRTPVHIKELDDTYRSKIIPSSIFDKLKGRLVAGGHRQDRMIYQELISGCDEVSLYNNTLSSPTVSIEPVMMQMALAAFDNYYRCLS
jgi:hypothetical protein